MVKKSYSGSFYHATYPVHWKPQETYTIESYPKPAYQGYAFHEPLMTGLQPACVNGLFEDIPEIHRGE